VGINGRQWRVSDVRPLYETATDLVAERAIAETIAGVFDRQIEKLPKQYRLDFAVTDTERRVRAFLEVKRRHNAHDRYPDAILSLSKVVAAKHLSEVVGVRSWFAIQWDDAIGYAPLDGHYTVSMTGRTDRGDWQDIEPHCHIPLADFKLLYL
jgi:hypothetical protein